MGCKSWDDGFSPLDICSFSWKTRCRNVSCPREGQGWPRHWPWMNLRAWAHRNAALYAAWGDLAVCPVLPPSLQPLDKGPAERWAPLHHPSHSLTHRRLPVPSHMGLRDASLDICQDENPSKWNDLFLNTKEKKNLCSV